MLGVLRTRNKGFTIVELLIVIVVIAILAAITIVAYTGIQERAKNTQMVSVVEAYTKGLKAYLVQNNDTMPVSSTACFNGNACWGGVTASTSQTLLAAMGTVMGTLPSIPSPYAMLIVPNGTTADSVNGGNYTGHYILYQQSDTFDCTEVLGMRYLNDSVAAVGIKNCRLAFE